MKSLVLFSGGVDSTVALAIALSEGRKCYALSFNYGQRHQIELDAAKTIAAHYHVPHQIITIDPTPFANSSLVNFDLLVAQNRSTDEIATSGIPNTYVPGRNTLFLAYALSMAEALEAQEIVIGANAMDASPYPDCRPEYFDAFQGLANIATKQAVEGRGPKISTPLLFWNKSEIVQKGKDLNAPLKITISCYSPNKNKPCEHCDACILRNQAFACTL
jgi:7-cyano-7-deazaguanine synthase